MRLSVLLPLLAVVACSDPASPTLGLHVETHLSAVSASPDEPVTVSVIAHNAGRRTLYLMGDSCVQPFAVATSEGQPIELPAILCTLSGASFLELPPAGRVTLTGRWGGESSGPSDPALPGIAHTGLYSVRGVVRIAGEEDVYGPAHELWLEACADGTEAPCSPPST